MHLNPYGEYATLLAASLADDWPADRAGIEARTRRFGMTMVFRAAPDDHERTRAVIDEWLRVVDAEDPADRAVLLNRMMAEAAAHPHLTDHDGEGWHLHYRDPDDALPYVLRAVIAVGTALHLATRGMHRLGRCAADPCTNVIVDITRNGRQRYCSVRCANRDAVRRHRARRA
ncbi:CGNR zinc finger domain-containing protein [Microbacterium resistens]|uniref:CGNR zinc finger domain-containing protein n=1 Tax=Microbacterium resistens TaxID=156977 RepID=A0ABY3RUM4_9MICO|nr:CGNR zinc finger domain-containing protein [Microbacterium resistens]MBW1638109.1 CGNR zinc finger domain-containing protein [Microbacterium resistens]UGS26611.1 CGNR zinc finger domain-containing protein [Microbacterium resistens]